MIIKGTVYPIGVINKNRWGVPDEEDVIASIINSLKSSKAKICPSCADHSTQHWCDLTDDGRDIKNVYKTPVHKN